MLWFPAEKEPAWQGNISAAVLSGQKYPAGQVVQATEPAKAKEPSVHGIARSKVVYGHACPAGQQQHNEPLSQSTAHRYTAIVYYLGTLHIEPYPSLNTQSNAKH